MKSPFPGMDPFIEAQHLWGDFHDDLIIEIKRQVHRLLPPGYVARVSDRTFIEQDDPDWELLRKTKIGPDIEVQRQRSRPLSSRYATDIQYDQSIRPPLNEQEAAFVLQHLQQRSP
ncbi:MAG: DUF4058 family protein [Pirellulaceae bacterium]